MEADALLVDFKNLGAHRKWFLLFVLGTVASMAWYVVASRGASSWPSGAAAPGLTFGIVAGLLILFEFLLWPRKTLFRVWRIGRTQAWLRAHIWLGLLTVPLIVLHSWRELGGTLTTVLVLLFAIVIASGIWGLVLQQFLPRAMLAQVPAETIYTQIGGVIEGFRQEARHLVTGVCGELPAESGAGGSATATANLELLEKAFVTVIEPYLSTKSRGGSSLANGTRSANFFRGLRDQLPIGVHPTIDRLEVLLRPATAIRAASAIAFLAAQLVVGAFAVVGRAGGVDDRACRCRGEVLVDWWPPSLTLRVGLHGVSRQH